MPKDRPGVRPVAPDHPQGDFISYKRLTASDLNAKHGRSLSEKYSRLACDCKSLKRLPNLSVPGVRQCGVDHPRQKEFRPKRSGPAQPARWVRVEEVRDCRSAMLRSAMDLVAG